jgi:hypothetical protein
MLCSFKTIRKGGGCFFLEYAFRASSTDGVNQKKILSYSSPRGKKQASIDTLNQKNCGPNFGHALKLCIWWCKHAAPKRCSIAKKTAARVSNCHFVALCTAPFSLHARVSSAAPADSTPWTLPLTNSRHLHSITPLPTNPFPNRLSPPPQQIVAPLPSGSRSSRCHAPLIADWWPARWEPQEEGVMNIAARFSLS